MLSKQFLNLILLRNSTFATRRCLSCNGSENLDFSKWRLEVALFIYRPPIVARPMTEVERQFAKLSEAADHRTSYKCDYELRIDKDMKLIEKRKQLEAEGRDLSALDEEIGISSIQRKKAWAEKADELTKMYNLKATGEEIAKENPQSMRRKLDRKLMLLVKQRFHDSPSEDYVSPWILPRLAHSDDDTLKQTADKCIRELFPGIDDLPVGMKVLGNAPISHFLQKYSKSMKGRLGFDGSVIFFYPVLLYQKSTMQFSRIDLASDSIADFKWCTRDELDEIKMIPKYKYAFSHALIE